MATSSESAFNGITVIQTQSKFYILSFTLKLTTLGSLIDTQRSFDFSNSAHIPILKNKEGLIKDNICLDNLLLPSKFLEKFSSL